MTVHRGLYSPFIRFNPTIAIRVYWPLHFFFIVALWLSLFSMIFSLNIFGHGLPASFAKFVNRLKVDRHVENLWWTIFKFLYDKPLILRMTFSKKKTYHFRIQFWDIEPQILTVFPIFITDYVENRWVIIGHSQISP